VVLCIQEVKYVTRGERVREARKSLDLTLEKFGERLGVGKTAVSNIECGNRSLTDQMCKSICREFNISEDWLRDGTGDMFVDLSRDLQLARFFGEVQIDEGFKKRFISALSTMTVDEWAFLERKMREIFEEDV
jgi:transcriptional regulator with XRE-family HTH domain